MVAGKSPVRGGEGSSVKSSGGSGSGLLGDVGDAANSSIIRAVGSPPLLICFACLFQCLAPLSVFSHKHVKDSSIINGNDRY